MKLIRFGAPGRETPGVQLDNGTRMDVSEHFADYTPEFFASGGLERLAEVTASGKRLRPVPEDARLGPPVARPGKFVAVGLNYVSHCEEVGLPLPKNPEMFTKYSTAICGPDDPILIPRNSTRLDYEIELAFVLKSKARYLSSPEEALGLIAGYMICNDVSEREFQFEFGSQHVKGKNCDNFGPLGPWLLTADECTDYDSLNMTLKVNGETRQQSSTSDMVFDVPSILVHLSQFFTLEAGDIVTTGTPPGVALGMDPPQWLLEGDMVELSMDKLGTQTQRVTALPEGY